MGTKRIAHFRYIFKKVTILRCHRCLIFSSVENISNILLQINTLTSSGLYCKNIFVSDDCNWCLCYKCAVALARVINYTHRVTLKIVASLTYNTNGIIFNHMLIEQATDAPFQKVILFYQRLIILKVCSSI
jgi:hypothetical protein